jgi:hypothetical protein
MAADNRLRSEIRLPYQRGRRIKAHRGKRPLCLLDITQNLYKIWYWPFEDESMDLFSATLRMNKTPIDSRFIAA